MSTQVSAKAGIKTFGEKSVADMIEEFSKIDKWIMTGKEGVTPINPDTLYFDDKRKALEAVDLIK